MPTTHNKMTYYTYKITFVDGYYYYGSRGTNLLLEEDMYWGTPVTNKEKWKTTMYFKTILDEYLVYKECVDAEIALIKPVYKTDKLCLNVGCGRGVNMTKEVREKLSKSHKGKTLSQEHKRKLSEFQSNRKRKPLSQETKDKIAEKAKGRKVSQETRYKIAEAGKGRQLSQEARDKIAASKRGKKRPPNVGAAVAEANRKRIWTEEMRAKLSKNKETEN